MKYERFLPFDDYQLLTPMNEEEVRNKIASVLEIGKKPFFSFKNSTTKPYEGRLTKEGFEMSRLINYRNSFLPQIRGQILPFPGGSTLYISMRPHSFVLVFMSFWLGVVGLVCLGILFSFLTQWRQTGGEGLSLPVLIPFVMFAAGYGMLMGAYRVESKGSKAFLAQLLNAQETADEPQR